MTSFAATRSLGPHGRAAALITGAVLAGHAALLGLWPHAPGPQGRGAAVRALQVRQISLAARPPALAKPALQAAQAAQAAPQVAPSGPLINTAALAPSPPVPEAAAALPVPAEPAAGGAEVPVYATWMPPPATLRFDMRRGGVSGWAELQWRPGAEGYELVLRGQAPGAPLLGWASQGGFDGAGLAPERYTESRRGRELRAANFQRGAGRITFSGPTLEYPLMAGAQDRLSWIVQLAAVLAANPALAQPGAQVTLFVVGTRGDAEVWAFNVGTPEALQRPGGETIPALPVQRQPRRLYDTGVQAWLDPARHYLPLRLRLAVRATGEGIEFNLIDSHGW